MANKTITQLSAVPTVADVDEFEVQVSGELTTKKCTRKQLTQIEETARINQDDVIEYAVGLNANGTYPSADFQNTWYLRSADHQAIVDRSGVVDDLTFNIVSALRLLDYNLYVSTKIRTIDVQVSAAEVLALNTAPKLLIDVEAENIAEVLSVYCFNDYNSTTYEAGTDKLYVRYASTETLFEIPNAFIEATADAYARGIVTANQVLKKGQNVELYCASNPTTGNGTFTISLTYILR